MNHGYGHVPQELRDKCIVVSASRLTDFKISPSYYYSKNILKEIETSDAMTLGTAIHMCVLEPKKFDETYCTVSSDFKFYSNDELKELCKSHGLKVSGTKAEMTARIIEADPTFWTGELETEKNISLGKQVLSPKSYQACLRIKEKVMNRKITGAFLAEAKTEVRAWFQLEEDIIVSLVIDAVGIYKGKGYIVDLKTTGVIDPSKIFFQNFQDGRHIQSAIYCEAMKRLTGIDHRDMFVFTFVETKAPYQVLELKPNDVMIDAGLSELKVLSRQFAECVRKNTWPDKYEDIQETSISDRDLQKALVDESELGI